MLEVSEAVGAFNKQAVCCVVGRHDSAWV